MVFMGTRLLPEPLVLVEVVTIEALGPAVPICFLTSNALRAPSTSFACFLLRHTWKRADRMVIICIVTRPGTNLDTIISLPNGGREAAKTAYHMAGAQYLDTPLSESE